MKDRLFCASKNRSKPMRAIPDINEGDIFFPGRAIALQSDAIFSATRSATRNEAYYLVARTDGATLIARVRGVKSFILSERRNFDHKLRYCPSGTVTRRLRV